MDNPKGPITRKPHQTGTSINRFLTPKLVNYISFGDSQRLTPRPGVRIGSYAAKLGTGTVPLGSTCMPSLSSLALIVREIYSSKDQGQNFEY